MNRLLHILLFLILTIGMSHAAPAPTAKPPQTTVAKADEHRYWVTSGSGKTHNRHCRYYGNSKGYYSATGTGNNCKICGGASRG